MWHWHGIRHLGRLLLLRHLMIRALSNVLGIIGGRCVSDRIAMKWPGIRLVGSWMAGHLVFFCMVSRPSFFAPL